MLRKLTSIEEIEKLTQLEELEIKNCTKIGTIDAVKKLKNLRKLWLIDCKDIQSLKPIVSLQKLVSLLFYGSTNITDGDLAPLTKIDNLRDVAFQPRKHYSHKKDTSTNQLFRIKA